jgi:hypothetical protein
MRVGCRFRRWNDVFHRLSSGLAFCISSNDVFHRSKNKHPVLLPKWQRNGMFCLNYLRLGGLLGLVWFGWFGWFGWSGLLGLVELAGLLRLLGLIKHGSWFYAHDSLIDELRSANCRS